MIYLLEDDNSIQKFVTYALNNAGFEVKGFETPGAFWNAMNEKKPDLLLLDVMLPEEDGISILTKLRATRETKKLPVIMLTAKGTEYDRIIGLDSGADDYVAKPFSIVALYLVPFTVIVMLPVAVSLILTIIVAFVAASIASGVLILITGVALPTVKCLDSVLFTEYL
jgi:CheY-like chemotaxis protein